jgi:hypothetical protein
MSRLRKELQEISRLLRLLIRITVEDDADKKRNIAGEV